MRVLRYAFECVHLSVCIRVCILNARFGVLSFPCLKFKVDISLLGHAHISAVTGSLPCRISLKHTPRNPRTLQILLHSCLYIPLCYVFCTPLAVDYT
jgi:hypothetical protein